jgi:hypothetical protein
MARKVWDLLTWEYDSGSQSQLIKWDCVFLEIT